MPTRELSAKNRGESRATNLSNHRDDDSDVSSDNDDSFGRRSHHDGRMEGGRGELKQLQDSLSRFFTPSNRRRSRVAQGSISLEHLDREVSVAQSPSFDGMRDTLHNDSGDEKLAVNTASQRKRAGRRRKNAENTVAEQKDYLGPLSVITDEPKMNINNSAFYNAQPSCSSSKTGLSSPSPRRKSDGLNDALSPYFSTSSEKRHSYSKEKYAMSPRRRRSLKSDESSSIQDQMPALSRMVDNSDGEQSNSDSPDEAETMDVLVDENSAWAASSNNYQPLVTAPKLTPPLRRRRRSSFSATSPLSVTSHNDIFLDSNNSTQRLGRQGRVRGARSGLQQYRMRGTHPNLRSSAAAIRKQESAASLVRKAKSRRRLQTNQLISTALRSAVGRRPGRKPRSAETNNSNLHLLSDLSPNKSFINQNQPKEFVSPTRALLKNRLANGELTNLTELDRNLFDAARKKVREDLASNCHGSGTESTTETTTQPSRNPKFIRIGQFEIETWYSSPYPEEYARLDTLFLCEFCLKYMKSEMTEQRHYRKCEYRTPPGDEIYRKDKISVFEVDGNISRIYCQNVCLLAKLFLDHKTLYYDVEPFLFYVITKSDEFGCHFVGYFSKEKYSAQRYNLSCIMTLPAYQRQGFGRFLIDFSFLLTRRENMLGTPERPLSDLGQISYRSYWQSAICEHIHDTLSMNQNKKVTIKSIARGTGISAADIVETLSELEMLEKIDSQQILIINWSLIESHWKKAKADKTRIWIDESKLMWSPKVYTPSKDYGVLSPDSIRSQAVISPLKSPKNQALFSPRNDSRNQHFDGIPEIKKTPNPRRKLFPSIEQKIRKNARKGRPPASTVKQSVLRPSSSVNYREFVDNSSEEDYKKKVFSPLKTTCKSDIQQRLRVRRKSSDDDSPDGRRSHVRGRGRKSLRRGTRRHLAGVKEDTSSLLSNEESKKSSRGAQTPVKLESLFGSDSSDDSEEPLSKHLMKKNSGRRSSALKPVTDIPKKRGIAGRARRLTASHRRLAKSSRDSDMELTSEDELSSSSESENAAALRTRGKLKENSSIDLSKKDVRKRKKTDGTGSVIDFRRRSSLSSSSAPLSSSESSSEPLTERLKERRNLSRNSIHSRQTVRKSSSRTLREELTRAEVLSKPNCESLSGTSESAVVNMGGAPSHDGSLSGGEEERKSLTQCGSEIYDHMEKEQSLGGDYIEKNSSEIPYAAGSVPMMEVSAESVKVQENEEPTYSDELPHPLSEMPQLRVADNVENAYDDEDAPPCLSPNFAPTEEIDEDSRNEIVDAPAPLLMEGAVQINYPSENITEQAKTPPQIQDSFSASQPPKSSTVLNPSCEMVNIGGEAASDDEMEDMDEQNAEPSCHPSSLNRISCDTAMMPSELSDFDRPLGAPRPADDHDSQNVAFDNGSYPKNENNNGCEEYNVKQLQSFNEILCEPQVPTHSPVPSSSSNTMNNNMVSPHFMPSSTCAIQQQPPGSANPCLTPQQPAELCTTSPNGFMGSGKAGSGSSAASTPHGPGSQHSQQMMSGEHSAFMSPPMSKPMEDIRMHAANSTRMSTMNESIRSDKPITAVSAPVQHQSHRRSSKKEQSRSTKMNSGASSSQRSHVESVLPSITPYVLSTSRPQPPMPPHFSQVAPSQTAPYYGGYPQPVAPTPFDSQFYHYSSTAYPSTGYAGHMQPVSKSHPVSAAMPNSFSYYPTPMPQGRNMAMPNGNLSADNTASPHNMMGVQCPPIQNTPSNASAWRYQNPSAATLAGSGFMEAAFGRGMTTSGNNAQFAPQLYSQSPYYPCLMPMMRPES